MRTPFFLTIFFQLTCFSVSALAATAGQFDHYDPAWLNEYALAQVRQGSLGTARIMLERAVRLAPYDVRFRENLRILRAQMDGKYAPVPDPNPASPNKNVPQTTVQKTTVSPDIPPVWESK